MKLIIRSFYDPFLTRREMSIMSLDIIKMKLEVVLGLRCHLCGHVGCNDNIA